MSSAIEYCGVLYDENVDWREFIAHPPYRGLEKDLDIQSALGALADALRDTPMAVGLADASLEVIEMGNLEQMERVRAAGWENAPNAFDRILKIVEARLSVLSNGWLVTLLGALLRLRPDDAKLLALLLKTATQPDAPTELLSLAARHNPRWLATHLKVLAPSPDARMARWLWVAPEDCRMSLLDAIARLGKAHWVSLVAQVQALPDTSKSVLLPLIRSHAGVDEQT